MFGASSTTEWHLNYDTTAQWYAPVNACQAAVIFTAGQLPYAKVTVCGGWVSVEATADVGNQPDAASLQAGLSEAWTMYSSPLSRNLCDALPSSLSNLAAHYDYFCVHEAGQSYAFEPAPAGLHNIACPFCYACWGRPWPGPAVDHHRRGASGLPRSGALLHWRVQEMPPPDPTVKRCSFGAPLSPRRPLCSPPASGSASISSPLQWRRCASTQRWFEVMQYGSTPTLLRWRPMSTPRTPCPTS